MPRPPIAPLRWKPPKRTDVSRPAYRQLTVVPVSGQGAEDVVVDHQGRVLTGVADGRILRVQPQSGAVEELADTGGRPLGLEFDGPTRVVVCDAHRGLLRLDLLTGQIEELVTEVNRRRLGFCNNAAVATDGTVYFTDSSTRLGIEHWKGELLEHSCTGRLMRRTPDGGVSVLLDRLAFANGVALPPDESFVVVAETGAYRLQRLWLTGPRAGDLEQFAPTLPGFPDNLSTGSDGLIWVTIAAPRDPALDLLLPRAPVLRRLAWSLPERLLPAPRRTVRVQAYDAAGVLVRDLCAPADDFHLVTGVREHHGKVWLGSLEEPAVAVMQSA